MSDGGASAAALFLSIPFLIIAAVTISFGALPRHNIMNGFAQSYGTVTDSHWELVQTDGGDYYDPIVHYNFLGEVKKSVVNGTGTVIFEFIGGHSCRAHGYPQNDKKSVEKFLANNFAVGTKNRIFYKPPDYFHCSIDDVALANNFKTGLAFFSLVFLCWCCPFFLLWGRMCAGLVACICCPIICPIYLCHMAFAAFKVIEPPHENHPYNEHWERVSSKLSTRLSSKWDKMQFDTSSLYSEGSRVEVNRDSLGRWHLGTVVRYNKQNSTWDVNFDSGGDEEGVDADRIRPPESNNDVENPNVADSASRNRPGDPVNGSAPRSSSSRFLPRFLSRRRIPASSNSSLELRVGSTVEANFRGSGVYKRGVIKRVHGDGTYLVWYFDGTCEYKLSSSLIRGSVGSEGSSGDGVKGVDEIDDGDANEEIDSGNIELDMIYPSNPYEGVSGIDDRGDDDDGGDNGFDRPLRREGFAMGVAVIANYLGQGEWYSGQLAGDYDNDTFDVAYDDGDFERCVPGDLIRLA